MKGKYKVLVVEEEEGLLKSLKEALEGEGYGAETAAGALEGLEKVKGEKYHIVLMDAGLSGMGGIELLKAVKSYDALTQVIMMSGNATMENILNALEYGANDYLLKDSLSPREVIGAVDSSVQKLERWREAILRIVK